MEISEAFRKVTAGAVVAGAGAAIVYLGSQIPGISAGEHGAAWGALAAVLVNAARQALRMYAQDRGVGVPDWLKDPPPPPRPPE